MKRIGIYLCDSQNMYVGIGEVERNLALHFSSRAAELKRERGLQLVYFVHPAQVGIYGPDVEYIPLSKNIRRLLSLPIANFYFHKKWNLDLVHWTHQKPKLLHNTVSPRTLVTVHDINFIHNDISGFRKWKKTLLMQRRLAKATHLSFISNFTKQDVMENFKIGVPSRVIYNGVCDLTHSAMEMMDIEPGFLFHISSLASKKNVDKLIEMMALLPNLKLVVAGGNPQRIEPLKAEAERLGLKNVMLLGRVSLGQKAWLLSNCSALCFPSQSEGFGLPVIEAMQFGKGAFLSPFTSLTEIGGSLAYYFDESLDPKSMAEIVKKNLPSLTPVRSQELADYAATFNWEKAVEEYINYYTDIISGE